MMRSSRGRFSFVWGLAVVLASCVAHAQPSNVQRYDFQRPTGPVAAGHTEVNSGDFYSAATGYGFLNSPRGSNDGTGHTWQIFQSVVPVEDAIPQSVFSDATVDCVRDSLAYRFRADVPPGDYTVTVWLGDVTDPLFQVRLDVNGVVVDVDRMDVNHTRGSFDQTIFGGSVPKVLTVDASAGFIEFQVGPAPGSDQPITWTYIQDEDPTQPPYQTTATLVPAYKLAALQAIEIHPAAVPPIVGDDTEQIAVGSAPAAPEITAAIALFNAGDIAGAKAAFEALSAPAHQAARAAGLFWVAGHPAVFEDEREILAEAITTAEDILALDPRDYPVVDLHRQLLYADDAERYRTLYGYAASGYPATQNLGRSCALTEFFDTTHPYHTKGRTLWLRNRGGLDPRRVTVSWEIAQDTARQLDPAWGGVNPHIRLYATDQWVNDGEPWTVIDWDSPAIAGAGPDWARNLVGSLNLWLDLFEWWAIHRQSDEGDIGGGWTDDVEIVPAFGLMAYVLSGASDILENGVIEFADGIWDSSIIDQAAGYQAQYADVEHTAEPTGNILHMYPLVRYGDPEGMERIMKSAKTFDDLFLSAPTVQGHRHFEGNHMSSTQIALNPNHRADIPLCGRVTAPFPWLVWYSENPGIEGPLLEWASAWAEDAARTENMKPAGVFPHAVWTPTDGIGLPGLSWYDKSNAYGQFTKFPQYHYYLYDLIGYFWLRTGDPKFLAPFDALIGFKEAWAAAGQPDYSMVDDPPAGKLDEWIGGKLPVYGAAANIALREDHPTWNNVLANFGGTYTRFLQNPTNAAPLDDLAVIADEGVAKWPYRTTEGVMTDRILVGGWYDVISYYIGADVISVFFGMPTHAVTWGNASRLFAAAVTDTDTRSLDVTTYLFTDASRDIDVKLWGLDTGRSYVLEAGPANDLGLDPTTIDQTIPFYLEHRGEGPTVTIPGRQTYAIRISDASPTTPSDVGSLVDLGVAPRDVSYDAGTQEIVVRVHNIGSQDAGSFVVAYWLGDTASGPAAAAEVVPSLEAPTDLVPRSTEVRFPFTAGGPTTVTVFVDGRELVDEINEENNLTTAIIAGTSAELDPPMIADLVPAVTTVGGTITVEGDNFQSGITVLESEGPTTDLSITFVDAQTLTLTVSGAASAGTYIVSLENPDGQRSNLVPLVVQ